MKTLKKTTRLMAISFLILPLTAIAQDNQMYWIHVDDVKPAMVAAYEATVKEAFGLLKQHPKNKAKILYQNAKATRKLGIPFEPAIRFLPE